jgi:CIC family chloride channel protein
MGRIIAPNAGRRELRAGFSVDKGGPLDYPTCVFGPVHKRLLRRFQRSENLSLVLLSVSVGLAGGLGAILFRYLIGWADQLFFDGGARALDFMGDCYVILLPAVGLLLVSMAVRRWAPEARGHGVPEVMYAVKKEGGRIRPRVAVIKALASAVTIGSGGSVGREGPIVQIGASVGSSLGQFFGLRQQRVRLLVACGAAAGIGGTFNAPIAGVLFALEVILGSFAARSFGLVVLASVTSTALCQAVLGAEPAFPLAQVFHLNSFWEMPIYLVLGLLAGLVAVVYVRAVYFLEDLFERWPWPAWSKAVIGGLLMGLVGWVALRFFGGRYLFGVGYDGIEQALFLERPDALSWSLTAGMSVSVLLLLTGMKILATGLTLAAGGSGGVFAPALFIGAMAGGAFGLVANALFPGVCAPPGAYALVGMGAVFAGSAHAPITAVLILFEMTDDYQIILPLMSAVVIAHLIASGLFADSIYTVKLRRRGGLSPRHTPTSALDLILVADAMSPLGLTAAPGESIADLAARMQHSDQHGFAVLDGRGRLEGIVTKRDVESALLAGAGDVGAVADIMTRNVISCRPDDRLRDVLTRLADLGVGQMPVVDRDEPGRALGMIRREQIFWAYGELAQEHQRLLSEAGLGPDLEDSDSIQVELTVETGHGALAYRRIRDIQVPAQSLIVMLRRAAQVVVPRGDTQVEPGDVLVLLTTRAGEHRLHAWVSSVTRGDAGGAE